MEQFLETGKKVLASGIEIKYLADEFLFRQGQKAEFVFYLHCGSILLEWPNENKSLLIANKPIFIGIQEVLQAGKYTCTVFDRAYFNQLITEFDHAKDYFESMMLEFTSQLNLQTVKV